MIETAPLPLSSALSRVSEELASLHGVSIELQDIVSDLGSGVPQKAQMALARIQRLDRLTQELEDLAPLLSRFADHAERSEWRDVREALHQVRLVSLRDRLTNVSNEDLVETGEAELF